MDRNPTSIDKIAHNVISTGAQRAVEIAAFIETEKRARMACGAKKVECIFGAQGTLLVLTWM